MMSEAAGLPSANRWFADAVPVSVVVGIIVLVWYAACIPMNAVVAEGKIAAAGGGLANTLAVSWGLDRPVIPAPHQIVISFWNLVFAADPTTPKSLIYHAWVTLLVRSSSPRQKRKADRIAHKQAARRTASAMRLCSKRCVIRT